MRHILFVILWLLFTCQCSIAQVISISSPINIRNNESYEVLNVKETPLVIRSDKTELTIDVFNSNTSSFLQKRISFERKNAQILSTSNTEDGLVIIYAYSHRGINIINAIKTDEFGNKLDTARIYSFEAWEKVDFRYTVSEDRSKTILFRNHRNEAMDIILFDNIHFNTIYSMRFRFDDIRTDNDFRRLTLSNEGSAFLVFHKTSTGLRRQKNQFVIHAIDQSGRNYISKTIETPFYFENFRLKYDNNNNQLLIAGVYNRKFQKRSEGYFAIKLNAFLELLYQRTNAFNRDLLKEYYKVSGLRERNFISDITLKDIIFRNDGGYVLIIEKVEIFSRQHYTDPRMRYRYGLESTYYSYGELIVISVHENGEEFWNRIIKKNQTSSSDRGMYSSYFIFSSPKEIRILFNDEIKDETQVIMHRINPLGKINRSALFNTELYDLRLMPREAIQVSGTRMIMPSLRNDNLRLLLLEF